MDSIKYTSKVKISRNKKQRKVINDYTIIGKLGEGGYSRVFLVHNKKKEYVKTT